MIATEQLLYRLRGTTFVILAYNDDPEATYEERRTPHVSRVNLEGALEMIRQSHMRWGSDLHPETRARLPTRNSGARGWFDFCREAAVAKDPVAVIASNIDCGDMPMQVMSERAYEERLAKEERAELEEEASRIARRHRVEPGTVEFIEALHEELDRVRGGREDWNNPEVRMEQWAACRYAGVGEATYFDDLNFENSRYDARSSKIQRVIDHARKRTPLLFAEYRERAARTEGRG